MAQVTTVQVTAYDAATEYSLTVGVKSVSVIAAGGANQTATALAAAWAASGEPELAEVTAEAATDTVTLTADEPGVPFAVTPGVSGGSGTIGSATAVTAATGPSFWSEPLNWSGGAAPANGDDVFLELSDDDIKYGLAQSGVTLASLNVLASFTGTVGLPDLNTDGAEYVEYRDLELAIGATALTVGEGPGQGSGRLRVNGGSVQSAVTVRRTAPSLDDDAPALRWRGTHASNVVNVFRGSVGVASRSGDAATVATLRVGRVESGPADADVRCGPGCTLTTVSQDGGTLELNSGCTTLTKTDGVTTLQGGGAYTTITQDRGELYYQSSGTVTTYTGGSDSVIDFTRDMRARTVTNCSVYERAAVLDEFKTVTFTNPIALVRCGIEDVTLRLGQSRTVAVAG